MTPAHIYTAQVPVHPTIAMANSKKKGQQRTFYAIRHGACSPCISQSWYVRWNARSQRNEAHGLFSIGNTLPSMSTATAVTSTNHSTHSTRQETGFRETVVASSIFIKVLRMGSHKRYTNGTLCTMGGKLGSTVIGSKYLYTSRGWRCVLSMTLILRCRAERQGHKLTDSRMKFINHSTNVKTLK